MTPHRWASIKALFEQALALPEGEQRQALLASAPSDVAEEAARLIALHERAGSFLSEPPPEAGTLRAPMELLPEGMLLDGRFEVRRLLGFGGMGQVYEAFDRELQQAIAIKTVSPEAGARFLSEIQIARRVTHPNVCRIFDIARHQDLVFCTMELLHGETLCARLKRSLPTAAELTAIGQQLCAGLTAAHQAGIVHRDLKPGNVFLEESRAVITDFGLAQPIHQPPDAVRHTGQHQIAGTLAYMAPEVLAGHPATVSSDLYSLGVLLYEAATGQLPFEAAGPLGAIVRRAIEPPASPRGLNPGIPRALDRAILACMAPHPRNRPASAQALAAKLVEPRRVFSRKTFLWGAAAAAGVSLSGIGYRFLLRGAALSGIHSVVLAIENETHDRRFDGIANLLRSQLQQSSRLEVLEERRVSEILVAMQRPADSPLDMLTAREVALRNGGTMVLYAVVSRLGPDLSLALKLEIPRSRPDFALPGWDERFLASGDQDLLARTRDAARWVRRIAGEPASEIDFRNRSPQDLTTFSWDALSQLITARQELKTSQFDKAEAHLKQALSIDPQFPSANRQLADFLVSQRRFKEGYAAWERAVEASSSRQLNSRERYNLESFYYDDIGDLPHAEGIDLQWIADYPADYLPHLLLANVYLRQNLVAQADTEIKKAAEMRPREPSVAVHLAYHRLAQGQLAGARRGIEELRSFAAPFVVDEVDGKARFISSQYPECQPIFERLATSRDAGAAHRGSLLLAALLAERGRFPEASQRLFALLPDDEAAGRWQQRAQKLIFLAELSRLASRIDAAVDYAVQAMRLDDGDAVQEQAGVLLARCGALRDAGAALEGLRKFPAKTRFVRRSQRLQGEILLGQGKLRAAMDAIRNAAAVTTTWDYNDSLAHGLEVTGALEEALQERIRLAQAKAFVWTMPEAGLPGAWTSNLSALIALARRLGKTREEDLWSQQRKLVTQ